ncbi:MAG: VOC family protein [Phycisphaerales bacterium]
MTASAEPAASNAQVIIALDVADLDASSAFYGEVLGFTLESTERAGLIFESRTFASKDHPALRLRLRAAFGRRPIGSSGGMLSLSLRVPLQALHARVAHLLPRVRWIGTPPASPPEGNRVRFADPDGYIIELFA